MVEPVALRASDRRRGAVARLRRDILLGRYRPREHLPAERELATQLGTNRNTLREALRTLENERLVESRQGDGTLVLDWQRDGEIALLAPFLAADTDVGQRLDAVRMLFKVRERLLDEAVIAAVGAADTPLLDDLAAAVTALRWSPPGVATARADLEVYRRLVLSTKSLTLTWIFNTFAHILDQLVDDYAFMWQNDADYIAALEHLIVQLRRRRLRAARASLGRIFAERNAGVLALLAPRVTKRRRAR